MGVPHDYGNPHIHSTHLKACYKHQSNGDGQLTDTGTSGPTLPRHPSPAITGVRHYGLNQSTKWGPRLQTPSC